MNNHFSCLRMYSDTISLPFFSFFFGMHQLKKKKKKKMLTISGNLSAIYIIFFLKQYKQ